MADRKKNDDALDPASHVHETTWGASQADKQEFDETVGEEIREAREDEKDDDA